jgi:transposase
MEALYGGIDLHSNNSVVAVIDAQGKQVCRRRLANDLATIERALSPYHEGLQGVVIESTFNWYWLVDGLQERGYVVHLANTTATEQYSGLKYGDDDSDARWLAEMLRLGILPEGYIYPKEERAVRDLLRKRAHFVRQRTANLLSMRNLIERNTGAGIKSDTLKTLAPAELGQLVAQQDVGLAIAATARVRMCLDVEIAELERAVLRRVKLRPEFVKLNTVPGVGNILALTIMLEAGAISRFGSVGEFASYSRCVQSKRLSNFKKKGKGNAKNGNRYLAWAFVEAANFAIRYSAPIQRFYQRKKARTNGVVAIKAVAHKLARAAYYILRDQVEFDVTKAFS